MSELNTLCARIECLVFVNELYIKEMPVLELPKNTWIKFYDRETTHLYRLMLISSMFEAFVVTGRFTDILLLTCTGEMRPML